MRTEIQRFRFLQQRLESARYSTPRLVVITGARQTGKTTLAQAAYPNYNYINLDAIEQREAARNVRTDAWATAVGAAILDEAQKEPLVFDKVKYAFDAGQITKSVLLGSSQILMLQKVRETLAGRAFIYELWPLLASEIVSPSAAPPAMPLLDRLLVGPGTADTIFTAVPNILVGQAANQGAAAIEHLLTWGGMPALLPLSDEERRKWLQSYVATYLERDMGDLARLRDLMPFHQFQRLCALRSGQLLSYSKLARDAGLGVTTSRRYVEYLRLSYQTFLLPPFTANLTSATIKSPKIYWWDAGLWRQQTGYFGPITGQLLETMVIAEIHKWVKTLEREASLAFYRTRSGLEVDLLMTTPAGVWGIEVKSARRLGRADWRSLREVGAALGPRWRGGIVVYTGREMAQLETNLWAVPAERLLVTA